MNNPQLSKTELERIHTDIAWFVGNSQLPGEALKSGDLAITSDNDLVIRAGQREIIESLKRRISTPQAFYERWILDVDGLKSIDSNYGNPAFNAVSEPMTTSWVREMLDFITLTVNQEDRVNLLGVSVADIGLSNGTIAFNIEYQILGSDVIYSLQLQLNDNDFFLLPD